MPNLLRINPDTNGTGPLPTIKPDNNSPEPPIITWAELQTEQPTLAQRAQPNPETQ